MKSLFGPFVLLLAIVRHSFAQNSSLLSAIDALPTCALQCLTTAVAQSPCELTDQTCICTNAQLQRSVETCVLQSCTVKQGLTTKNVTASTCGAPIQNKAPQLKAINISLSVISNLFVLARIVYKLVIHGRLDLDDYFIIATLLIGMASAIIIDRGALQNGLGKNIWTLEFSQITNFIRFFYVMEVLYFAEVTLLKLSLLFFFERVFPGVGIRRAIWATIVFNILFGIAFILAGIFQCSPIDYYWNAWDGEHLGGSCIDVNALGWSNAAISIVVDLWMLAMPLSQVIHLRMAWRKKVGVALMFCVGTFVTVVSILRLHSLVHFAKSSNPTSNEWDMIRWSTVEINVGIICTCMPAVRMILQRTLPKVFGSRSDSSGYYHDGRRKGTLASTSFPESHGGHVGDVSVMERARDRTSHSDEEQELVELDMSSRKLPDGKVENHDGASHEEFHIN